MATLPKREPTSAEYQALLNENDALRLENVQLRQTIMSHPR
jgi:regulator of replication initiation timing